MNANVKKMVNTHEVNTHDGFRWLVPTGPARSAGSLHINTNVQHPGMTDCGIHRPYMYHNFMQRYRAVPRC